MNLEQAVTVWLWLGHSVEPCANGCSYRLSTEELWDVGDHHMFIQRVLTELSQNEGVMERVFDYFGITCHPSHTTTTTMVSIGADGEPVEEELTFSQLIERALEYGMTCKQIMGEGDEALRTC